MTRIGWSHARRALFLVPGLLFSGCVSTIEIPREDWGGIPDDQEITITTLAGARSTFGSAALFQDSLEGVLKDSEAADRVRIPLDSIEFIEIRRTDIGPILVVATGVAAGIAISAALGEDDTRPEPRPRPSSSCPLVYSFDGEEYRLDSETYSGAVAQGLERVDVDNLDHLEVVDGAFHLLMSNERPETQYTDELSLFAVDHPTGSRVLPDSKGKLHAVETTRKPTSAWGIHGGEVMEEVAGDDGLLWTGAPLEEVDPAVDAHLRDGILLTFQRPASATAALVVNSVNTPMAPFALEQFLELQGDQLIPWYRELKTDPKLLRKYQDWVKREGLLQVSLEVGGEWVLQDWMRDVGPNLPKTQVALLDLSGTAGKEIRVKLESARGLWAVESVALGQLGSHDLLESELALEQAMAKDGRDARGALSEADGTYHSAFQGDRVDLKFTAPPPPGPGLTRSFILRTRGFYHLHTAHSGPARSQLADRILDEPLFGNRFLLMRWRALQGPGFTPRSPGR